MHRFELEWVYHWDRIADKVSSSTKSTPIVNFLILFHYHCQEVDFIKFSQKHKYQIGNEIQMAQFISDFVTLWVNLKI